MNHTYVPPQHGAWAFLGLPLVLGLTLAAPTWAVLPLAVAWVSAYPWSYAAFGLARAKRKARFRRPLVVWTVVLVPALVLLLVVRPWLLWWSPLFVVGFLVNLLYASRNDERAIVNDLVLVLECAAIVVVTWAVDTTTSGVTPPSLGSVPSHVWLLALLCALMLTGSTLHVKSLIRERRDVRYARASRGFAVMSLLLTPLLARAWGLPQGWWFTLPLLFFAVRSFVVAAVVARRPVRPAPLGMVELVGFVLAALAAVLAR